MDVDDFSQQIDELCSRVAALLQCTDLEPKTQQQLLKSAFSQLHIALAELKVAVEELHQQNKELCQQNEDLAAAKAAVAAECQTALLECQRYQELFESAPDKLKQIEEALQERLDLAETAAKLGSFEWNIQTNVIIWSKELEALYGLMPGEFGGSYEAWARCVHPDDLSQAESDVQSALVTGKFFTDFRVLWRDGSIHWLHSRAKVFFEKGKPLRMVGVNVDITERKQAESALQESEQRYRLLFESNPHPMWVYDLHTLMFLAVNDAAINHYGYQRNEFLAMNIKDIRPPEDVPALLKITAFTDRQYAHSGIWKHQKKDGTIIDVEITSNVLTFAGRLARVVLVDDITKRKQAEAQLLHNAFHDQLTGLPNRALFMDRLGQTVEQAKRHESNLFAVLFLDLDRFKVVNDSLGHILGDQFLITIALRLQACLRPTDTVARLGGDEFTILLEGLKDISDAVRVAERIQQELAMPFFLNSQEVFSTASIGIALSTTGYDRPENILRDADIAMYRAKRLGSGRYEIFNPDMHVRAASRLQLETALRRAVEHQEFRIHYQPIVSLATGRINGFEALVRWQHPLRGLVPPAEFIPVAVETGLSISIDRWVLAKACSQIQQWQEQYSAVPPLSINVNLCCLGFAQPDLVEHLDQVLRSTNLDAHRLKLEITESVIMENSSKATLLLKQLRDLGVQLCIDDFGTGYSSLSRLHQFPINVLKVDRSFFSRMGIGSGDLQIVDMLLTLAQKLGLQVIAEGIETVEQLRKLKELKCEYGQGYLFAPALATEAAEALIISSPQW